MLRAKIIFYLIFHYLINRFFRLKSFFKKILGIKDEESDPEKKIESIPIDNFKVEKPNIPLDEKFAENFTNTGGKFIHCLNQQEVLETIKEIISENDWDGALSFDQNINELLKEIDITHSDKSGTNSVFFTACEALIANDGSILVSSNQLKGRKLPNLPYDFIIIARIEDIISNRSDGLGSLTLRYGKDIPSGITTIKGPKTVTGTNNILDSGSINTSKNIYLLLAE